MTHCSRCDASVSKPGLCEKCRGMEDLIERLSGATGPAFVLDQEIARTIGAHQWHTPPAYTASLDAAMTLIPQNWTGCLDGIGSGGVIARFGPPVGDDEYSGEHPSAAIALCIASLKARSLKGDGK